MKQHAIFQKLKFAVITLLLLFVFIEMLIRIVLSITTVSFNPFLFGFNRNIQFTFTRNSLFFPQFYSSKIKEDNNKSDALKIMPKNDEKIKINKKVLTFGGSTTEGNYCSGELSSWPMEWQKLNQKLEIVNLGLSGSDSDYAIKTLLANVQAMKPDAVIWSGWINEIDAMYRGTERNSSILQDKFPDIFKKEQGSFRLNRFLLFLLRIDKTMSTHFVSYNFLTKFVEKVNYKLKLVGKKSISLADKETKRGIEFSVTNYSINLNDAFALSKKYKFELIIVRLPINWQIWSRTLDKRRISFLKEWNDSLFSYVNSFALKYSLKVIDIHTLTEQNGFYDEDFCDNVHQTQKGHVKTAKYVNAFLQNSWKDK